LLKVEDGINCRRPRLAIKLTMIVTSPGELALDREKHVRSELVRCLLIWRLSKE
jgi:hypothetical protein